MAISHQFEYFRPNTVDEALGILKQFNGKASLLAGGTDLVNWIKEDFVTPEALIDIKNISELKKFEFTDKSLFIGSTVTFNELILSEKIRELFPLIYEQSKAVASHGVRNRATMVGNICSAVPCCDSGPVLKVYDAVVHLKGPDGTRQVAIEDWFVGPKKTSITPLEIVTGVEILLPNKKNAGCYVKLGRYKGEDLAQASVALLAFEGGEIRVSFGSVAPTPVRSKELEDFIKGRELTPSFLNELDAFVEKTISPISDVRATKEYRDHMTKIMLKRGLCAVKDRLADKGPQYGSSVI